MTFSVFPDLFVHYFWDFPCFYSFSWLFEILFIFMDFWDFVMSMTFEILFISWLFWDFVHFQWLSLFFLHFSWLFEILFMFMRFCSCSRHCTKWQESVSRNLVQWYTPKKKKKKKKFHSCSFNLCCVKRCGTEGENLKERDFFKCFFLMTLPI